jgi:hypothetical protein
MADDSDWAIKVTADISEAGQAFDQLLSIVDGAASKVTGALRSFDAALGKGSGSMLQTVAAMTPVGRAVNALVTALDGAVTVGGKLAEVFGAQDQFETFTNGLSDLKTAVSDTFDYILNAGFPGDGQLGKAISTLVLGDQDALKNAFAALADLATRVTRDLQVLIESLKPADALSDNSLEKRIESLAERLAHFRADLETYESDSLGGKIARALDLDGSKVQLLRNTVDSIEEELARLRALLAERMPEGGLAVWSPEVEKGLEGLRRQNQELETSIATFGMAAGAAARYRAELEALRAFTDEGGARGPLFDERWPAVQEQLDRLAANRQRLSEMESGRRSGDRREGILGAGESQVRQLEIQARTLGHAAGETARLTQEERLLEQLRRAKLPIDEETRAEVARLAESFGAATQRLADLRRGLEQVQAYGSLFSSSLERAFSSWLSGAEVNWKQFFNKLVADLATLALRQNVLQPLFGGGGVQGGGLFGSLIQGLVTPSVPGRAEGGPIMAGMPYWVGERGPELVVPRMDGYVVPNGAAVPARGETRVTVNNYANAEVEAGEDDNGEVQINIIRAVVRDEFASGRMNPVMAAKHGIRPRLRAR